MQLVGASGLIMCCSFAVVRFVFVFSFVVLNMDHYCQADKAYVTMLSDLFETRWSTESVNCKGGTGGVGWIKVGHEAISYESDMLCENWFFSNPKNTGIANRVYLKIDYTSAKNCNASGCGLFVRAHKGNVASSDGVTKEHFKESFELPPSIQRRITVVHFDMESNKPYLIFAVQAKGVRTVVYNISVYYYYCPRKALKSVTLKKTPAPSSGFTKVEGHCYRHLSNIKGAMVAYCSSNGTWENFSQQTNHCRCSPGKQFDNQTGQCIPCKENHFKTSVETDSCKPCLGNTESQSGAIICKCPKNHYKNGKDVVCRKLPPKPVNLAAAYLKDQANTTIQLSWEMPYVSRNDVHYVVKCTQCGKSSSICDKPCKNTSIAEEGTNVTKRKLNVTLYHNDSKIRYKFYVTSLNGVCNEENRNKWQTATVTLNIKDTPKTSTDKKVDVATSISPTSRKVTSPGSPGEVSVPKSDDKATTMTPLTGLAIAIAALAVILLIVGIIVYKSKRMRKQTLDEEILLAPFEKSYIDPAKFGNSEKAVRKFAKEIDRRQVKLDGLIGEGEFAKVHKGTLCRPNQPATHVAVKVLKPGSSAKNREDFLTEAAVMGQFKDMNIVSLEGVVTISHPVMIITEFMHNGALSTYLAEYKNRLLESQLLAMARGIASGMKYLARMRFVHRDLAARNVLVNENLVCKVADFGLTRELEESCQGEYVTQGGKIPIRWTAPEAYKFRRFTTASDVWSYGILLWEILSYAERPYGNWDNYMVMERVIDDYRLTPPTNCPKIVHQLMMECWKADRNQRPAFADIVDMLERWIKNPYLLKDYEYVIEKSRMVDRKSCVAKSIREHLEGIKMERYFEKFIDYGYTELYQIEHLTDGDLVCVGVPLVGHRNKIMKSMSLRSERAQLLPTNV